jgi:hypothetical protein
MFDKKPIQNGRESGSNYSQKSYRSAPSNKKYTPRQKKSFLDSLHNWHSNIRYGMDQKKQFLLSDIKHTIIYGLLAFAALYLVWVFGAVYTQLPTLTPE